MLLLSHCAPLWLLTENTQEPDFVYLFMIIKCDLLKIWLFEITVLLPSVVNALKSKVRIKVEN